MVKACLFKTCVGNGSLRLSSYLLEVKETNSRIEAMLSSLGCRTTCALCACNNSPCDSIKGDAWVGGGLERWGCQERDPAMGVFLIAASGAAAWSIRMLKQSMRFKDLLVELQLVDADSCG